MWTSSMSSSGYSCLLVLHATTWHDICYMKPARHLLTWHEISCNFIWKCKSWFMTSEWNRLPIWQPCLHNQRCKLGKETLAKFFQTLNPKQGARQTRPGTCEVRSNRHRAARRDIDESQWGPAPVLESAFALARAGPSGTNIVTNRLGTTSKSSYPKPSAFCSESSPPQGCWKEGPKDQNDRKWRPKRLKWRKRTEIWPKCSWLAANG